ncbi:MAG: M24 family metallopeptidase [Fidelibacterota bacterium]
MRDLIQKRVVKLKERLSQEALEGMLITNLTNVRYLSGFTGSAGTCLIFDKKSYFISDGRYLTQAREQVQGMEVIIDSGTHLQIIKRNKLISNGAVLGFEADYLTVSQMNQLQELFPQTQWESTSRIVEEIAAIKDESELRALRVAIEITDKVFDQLTPELRPGSIEREVAAKISFAYKILGADGDSYHPIVASGPNSALPHAVPSDRVFQNGDFVVLDFGALYQGYHADMTRTIAIGTVTDRHREVYAVVQEAQQRGCQAARAGMTCRELDTVTRNYISEQGYGDYYVHGTGHGLGLEVHTMPRVSQVSEDTLQENYVVTIEPGIYIPDWGGVRIEDDILICKDGAEVLNQSPRDLMVLN